MDRSYRNRLLREAAENPSIIVTREKFWKLEWWPHYLRRCDDILYGDPAAGLAFTKPAPQLAAKIAQAHPGENGADLMLLGHSYLGGAFRRTDDYGTSEDTFREARRFKSGASPKALAEHLRRYAYLRIFQRDPVCFPIIGEAISIHKRGNLVHRHALGECLICRARAFAMFDQHGRSFDDYTAALNHVSIQIDWKPYYCALHNLAAWAIDHGTDEELQTALDNLKPAQAFLRTLWGHPYAKLKMRWLIALVEGRLGNHCRAESEFLEVRDGLVGMKLIYEVGMLYLDLALLYLVQGRKAELQALVDETAATFRQIGVEAKAQEALDIWRQAEDVTEDLLKRVRRMFAVETNPRPVAA